MDVKTSPTQLRHAHLIEVEKEGYETGETGGRYDPYSVNPQIVIMERKPFRLEFGINVSMASYFGKFSTVESSTGQVSSTAFIPNLTFCLTLKKDTFLFDKLDVKIYIPISLSL